MNDISSIIIMGDLSRLSYQQKVDYHNLMCEKVGLDPITRPFDYIKFQGKEVLYANKNCAEQLRKIHNISILDCEHKQVGETLIVTVKAKNDGGRHDVATSAISIGNLKGDALANAIMKAETKAKRRVTLSICSLGMLDETETETIPGAVMVPLNTSSLEKREDFPSEIRTRTGPKKSDKAVYYRIPEITEDQELFLKSAGGEYDFIDDVWILPQSMGPKLAKYEVELFKPIGES